MNQWHTLPELDNGVHEALQKVYELGAANKKEHLIWLRGGKQMGLYHGDELAVRAPVRLMRPGDEVVHNHPGLQSLSNTDISLASENETVIYAITEDKSIYRAVSKVPDMLLAAAMFRLENVIHKSGLQDIFLSSNVAKPNLAHWANLQLAKVGVLDYTYAINEPSQQMYEKQFAELILPNPWGEQRSVNHA